MKKQKICIIGGSLAGLTTAISLSRLDCEIDLIAGNLSKNLSSNRTIAISENNFDYLNKLNISKGLRKESWACSKMKLYTEVKDKKFSEIFVINKENKKENIFYTLENKKIMKLMIKKIEKIKSISLKKNQKVLSISTKGLLNSVKFKNKIQKYNLIIVCTGYNSDLIKNIFQQKIIKSSYGEIAITTILKHFPTKNNTTRQIFLDDSIFAFLPISHTKTSIVWSVKKSGKVIKNSSLRKKIKFYTSNFIKNIKFIENIEHNDLNLFIREKYFTKRILLFGDALHVMHPFIGQGFNMTLRDLSSLEQILLKKIKLGLDIGGSDVLSEFTSEVKPRNFIFSTGSDFLKKSISFKKARNDMFKILNKSNLAKNIFFNIADKGLRF